MTPRLTWVALTAALLLTGMPAARADFAIAISPPRFEVEGRAGQVSRHALTLNNGSALTTVLQVSTADWRLAPDGTAAFTDELAPDSCRPWVAIERRSVSLAPGGQYKFRFEVTPPADTPARECRFALMFGGDGGAADVNGLRLPIAAQVAVIVYLRVGDARPVLRVAGSTTGTLNQLGTPALLVRNDGLAHGRVAGFLSGTDAAGTPLDYQPATTPILPGETRVIPLVPSRQGGGGQQVAVRFPVTVKGRLELSEALPADLDLRIGP